MESKKVGRPKNSFKYNEQFYISIVEEHKDLSLSKIAKKHNVCTSTAIKWVAKGRDILNERELKSK
jgi:transposase-like protein